MIRTALLLAAHGAGAQSAANRRVTALADHLAATMEFAAVVAAFHLGTPTYAEALDSLDATHAVVVPLMTSEGYYCQRVLRRGLARSRRLARVHTHITPALGTHPALSGLVARRIRQAVRAHQLEPRDTTIAVVGHGAVRHPESCAAAVALRDALRQRTPWARVEAAFLSSAPCVEEMLKQAAGRTLLVVPFLVGGGYHASIDIYRRLGVDSAAVAPTSAAVRQGRTVVLGTLGDDPAIGDLVRDLACAGQRALRARDRRTCA